MIKIPDDLSIPDFLLVKNRPKDKSVSAAGEGQQQIWTEPWEQTLATVNKATADYIREAMRKGRFAREWLVVDHRRSQADVAWTLAHWQAKLEKAQQALSARAAEAKAARRQAKDAPVALPHHTIVFGGKNPKKPGTPKWKKWQLIIDHDGKTVAAFLKAKGDEITLAKAVKRGYVTLIDGKESKEQG